jgi:hypothetical protein
MTRSSVPSVKSACMACCVLAVYAGAAGADTSPIDALPASVVRTGFISTSGLKLRRVNSVGQLRRVVAWGALIGITLLLASMLQALAAGALVETGPAGLPDACLSASPATAALADGDDVRAGFLANLCHLPGGAP